MPDYTPVWLPRDGWTAVVRGTFEEVERDRELTATEAAALYTACDLLDQAEAHATIAAEAGWLATGSAGQVIEHPLSASARTARTYAARILNTLRPTPGPATTGRGSATTSDRARAAARARWGSPGVA